MIGKYKIIALCTCRIQDKESHNFIAMLNEKLLNIGCRLFIYNTSWVTPDGKENNDPQLSIYELIDSSFIDAVIIQTDRFFNEKVCKNIVDRCLANKLPVVSLGIYIEGCINIQYNHQKGFKDVILHVINDHNVRDLHLIAGTKDNKYSIERVEVFKEVLKDYNIEFNENLISYGDFWPIPAKRCVLKLINENRLPKAFICANDNMAIAVTEVLIKNGINVPNDIIVTGYDCIDAIYSSEPTITSAFISSKISAQVIFETIENIFSSNINNSIVSLDSNIVINESCGCQSNTKLNLTPYLNEQISRFCQFQDDDIVLAEFTTRLQQSSSLDDILNNIKNNTILDPLCILLKEEFFDFKLDIENTCNNSYSNNMLMLYNSIENNLSPRITNIYEFMPHIIKLLDEGRSLIFSALHYQDMPIGYVCFYFDKHIISNYYKVPQIINSLNNGLGAYRNKQHQQYLLAHIESLYKIDPLTGLYNRRGFLIEYESLIKNNKKSLNVIMCDLDGLKVINDTYGHEEGDIAIMVVAKALKYSCPNNAIITRFGGDEMLSIFDYEIVDIELYNKFNEYLNNYNSTSLKPYKVSASLGIYHTKENDVLTFEELIKYSDHLMYKDKLYKKNRSS